MGKALPTQAFPIIFILVGTVKSSYFTVHFSSSSVQCASHWGRGPSIGKMPSPDWCVWASLWGTTSPTFTDSLI